MNVILQRQGWGKTIRTNHGRLLTPGPGNDAPPFYVELTDWQGKGFFGEITYGADRYTLPHPNLDCPRELYPTIEAAKAALGAKLTELTGEPVTIDPRTEAYFIRREYERQLYPFIFDDVEFQRARYEEGSNTIRSVPENYCLIGWQDGDINKPVFDVDAATAEPWQGKGHPYIPPMCYWRKLCEAAHALFLQEVNQSYGPVDSKRWLAWIISEWRKYGINH